MPNDPRAPHRCADGARHAAPGDMLGTVAWEPERIAWHVQRLCLDQGMQRTMSEVPPLPFGTCSMPSRTSFPWTAATSDARRP